MGLLSWFTGSSPKAQSEAKPSTPPNSSSPSSPSEVPGMNGAVEVPRTPAASNVTVFEFGSVASTADKVTLAGYCPVSDELEPCRWEILPATGSEAPQFRIVF